MTHHILTLQCPDRPGIVAALARGIGRADGNILDSAQFSDPGTGLFCVRTELESPLDDADRLLELIGEELAAYSPELTLRPKDRRRRALLMVSKIDHCLVDLLYRWDRGELPIDIPVVVSNHEDLRSIVASGEALLSNPKMRSVVDRSDRILAVLEDRVPKISDRMERVLDKGERLLDAVDAKKIDKIVDDTAIITANTAKIISELRSVRKLTRPSFSTSGWSPCQRRAAVGSVVSFTRV